MSQTTKKVTQHLEERIKWITKTVISSKLDLAERKNTEKKCTRMLWKQEKCNFRCVGLRNSQAEKCFKLSQILWGLEEGGAEVFKIPPNQWFSTLGVY